MKTTKAIILIALIAFISNVSAQSISINQNFTSDAEIFPFDSNDTIYGLSITGSVTLNSDTSLVRIILADTNYYEYMAYEAYPLIVDTFSFDISGVCDETCYLDGINPYSIKIQIIDAGFYFQRITPIYGFVENADSLCRLEKESIEWNKVATLNNHLRPDALWGADTCGYLWYDEKKEKYGEKYNLLGFDYFSNGIYHANIEGLYEKDTSSFRKSFDWRKQHGANLETSPYYAGPNGFITRPKSQDSLCVVSCWLYAAMAVIEADLNLFFNKSNETNIYEPVNAILSEQHYLSCDNIFCNEGWPRMVFTDLFLHEAIDETCCPNYQDFNLSNGEPATLCDNLQVCSSDTSYIISIGIWPTYTEVESLGQIKRNLIKYGPSAITRKFSDPDSTKHCVALVGYNRTKQNDTIYRGRNLDPIIIEPTSPWIDKTYLRYKESSICPGFDSILYSSEIIINASFPNLPLIQGGIVELERLCLDLDRDGYYNWGIGEKPGNCPSCPDNIDSDDNNPRIGPYDTNYNSLSIQPEINITLLTNNGNMEVKQHDAYAYDTTLFRFNITNNGSAQLNLSKIEQFRIDLQGPDADSFEIEYPDTSVVFLEGGVQEFILSYIGNSEFAVTDVIINIDEEDMQDFSFTLARAKCSNTPGLINITGDTTWENNNIIMDNVTISNNAKLTITSTIGMGASVNMYVGQGSKLVVDGGKLTNACSSLWGGVDVYGDPDYSQSYTEYHGEVQVINGGCIQYAINGIETTQAPPRDGDGYAGGIIKIDSGTIRNNITAVKFRPFQNTKPGTGEPWPNVSYIKNCQFITDEGLYSLNETPEQHIMFLDVSGIPVTSCTFYNTTEPQQDPAELGKGILSVDADFYLNGKCVERDPYTFECTKWQQSRFSKLDYGVYAVNTHSNKAPTIKRTLFEKNKTGIYLSMTPQASVTLCDFDINKKDYFPANEHFAGLYLNAGCDGFQVEENYFYNSDNDPFGGSDSTIGIVVNNSGAVSNEVYNNYFEDLDFGVSAQGTNKGESIGLQIKCNDFDSCEYNIVVVPDSCVGIYYYQGSDTALATGSANNLFSYMGSIEYDDLNDINNMGEFIAYYFPPNAGDYNVEPKYIDTLKVSAEASNYQLLWTFDAGCPSLLGNDTSIQEIKSLSLLYENKADSINGQLQELEDGGNTEELNTNVQTSWPEDAYDVYSELINNSPYLSDSVMVSAVKKEDVLSGTMVTDVLSANPQAAKRDTVMNAVYKRNNPLNNDQLNQVNQGLSQIGLKEKLEAELGFYKTKKAYYNSSLLRIFRKDTSLTSINDSIISVYKRINNVDAKYQLAIEYLWLGDTSNAMNTLDSIPFKFTLNNYQTAQHTDYEDYFNWIIEIIGDGRGIFSADSIEIEGLYDIYNNTSGKPKSLTRNLLMQIDALSYHEPYYFPTFYKSSKIAFPEDRQNNENKCLYIYPNPSNSYYYVECKLKKEPTNCYVIISDVNGRIIDKISVEYQTFRKIIDARNYKPGLYIGRLHSNGNIIESAKFIIIH